MRICLLSPSILETPPVFGGAIETFTYELGLSLAELNNQVLIITRGKMTQKSNLSSNLTIYSINLPKNSLMRGVFYNFTIIKILLKLKAIQILHTQGTSVFPSAYLASKWLGIPVVHTEHVYYPWILPPVNKFSKRIKYPFELFLGKFTLNHADKIIVASEFMKKALQRMSSNIKQKLEIVPQGIKQDLFNPKLNSRYLQEKYKFSATDKLILYVGRIIPEKGIDTLIKAFYELKNQYDNVKLLLVGPKQSTFLIDAKTESVSNYYLKLKSWIQRNNLQNSVIFTGSIPYENIPYYYSGCTLFVQPSPLETFGRSILEAAAMGIPFICSHIGKNNLSLPDSGIFLKKLDSFKLHSAMKSILENEAEFRKKGKIVAQLIQSQFNWIRIAKIYLQIYRNLIKK